MYKTKKNVRGTCVAQLIERLALAQVMMSQVHEFEPRIKLCADSSEEPASNSVSPSLCLLMLCLSLSKMNKY